MSEREEDNNENPVIDSEVVSSEVIEQATESVVVEPVVIKKGSVLSYLAFVLSLAAIGLSGYLYYLQLNTVSTVDDNNNHLLKASIAQLENKSNKQFDQLNQLLQKATQHNQKLDQQLQALQQQTSTNNNTGTQSIEPYDDSVIIGNVNSKFVELSNRLNKYHEQVENLQNNITSYNQKNSDSFKRLEKNLKTQQTQQTQSSANIPTAILTESNNKALAANLLQEAYVQLNINGNLLKGQQLLTKTIQQLTNLTGLRYGRLAIELEEFLQQLTDIQPTDTESLKSSINHLSATTEKLVFADATQLQEQGEKQESSWYDNLISIKKIDENSQSQLSKSEKITVMNVIGNHYQMMKIALMSNNQNLWLSEITVLQALLTQHFADNAQQIQVELAELKATDINPKLPDLEAYLEKFKAINRANENE